ncbi:PTS system, ascorbate-specific IIB component [Williamsoniiplasma somnilux]|uniref:PTS system, ascorbate-specific IIB component n=1 Tax=Williamsoniiplasma somnilux TaxID=215578 RepID=A0A2K8NX73_9MOLU|nr:hypothetical protein [Williamsoniiplasma somnilux]ATZ18445.1 PTS system, ascorbate-specific IIB component [Williamsoniiplasma somnilux]
MKIIAVCGQGLGSSLVIEMNMKDAVDEIGADIEIGHTNLNSFDPNDSSISAVVCGKDLEDAINHSNKIVLNNLFDKDELKEKIENFINNYA